MTTRVMAALAFSMLVGSSSAAQTTDATYPTTAARMFRASTSQAWAAVFKVLADAGLKDELKNESGRFVITKPVPFDSKRFGFKLTDMLSNASAGRVQYHIFVPRYIEPARVYVGSTLTADVSGARGQMLIYSTDRLGEWLLSRVGAALAVSGHAIPQSPARRAALGKTLLPDGEHACLDRLERGEQQSVKSANNWMAPRNLFKMPMAYPRSGAVQNAGRTFNVNAIIAEDGFTWPIGVVDGSPDDDFAVSAMATIPMWRFSPLMIDGCPAPNQAVVTTTFVVK